MEKWLKGLEISRLCFFHMKLSLGTIIISQKSDASFQKPLLEYLFLSKCLQKSCFGFVLAQPSSPNTDYIKYF